MIELFVYFRVREADAAAVLSAIVPFQAALSTAHPDLQARLLRRPETVEGLQTWMETYRCTDQLQWPQGICGALRCNIDQGAPDLLPLLASPRHVERFIPCA
jgi:hypothetical protein